MLKKQLLLSFLTMLIGFEASLIEVLQNEETTYYSIAPLIRAETLKNSSNFSSCDLYFEKLYLLFLKEATPSEIFANLPLDYNIFFDTNLNKGIKKAANIILAASYKCNVTNPITMLKVSKKKQCEADATWDYIPNSDNSSCPGMDLNKGVGGKRIYLYSSTSRKFPTNCNTKQFKKANAANTVCCDPLSNPTCATRPIKSIRVFSTKKNKPTYSGYYVDPQDLNEGASEIYVFLAWQT